MNWQLWLTLSAASVCGIWAIWYFIKPFWPCAKDHCNDSKSLSATQDQLIQITPLHHSKSHSK